MKYSPYKIPTEAPKPDPIVFANFGGIDKSTTDTEIDTRHSPGMKNMIYDDDGILNKWPGYKSLVNIGSPINGLFTYADKIIAAAGTKLYKLNTDGTGLTEIYSGMSGNRIKKHGAFIMNDKFYILDGKYLQYDGTSVVDVTTIAYVPTLTMGRSSGGGGKAFEQFNMLTPWFIDSFSVVKDGSGNIALTYPMSLEGLDTDKPLVVSNDGGATWSLTETTKFTVNRDTGKVTFLSVSDLHEGTDLLKIKAAKTVAGMKEKILNCKITGQFGGPNDSHVFFTGNTSYKNTDWRSGVLDPTYIPENSWTNVGGNDEAITGYEIQYDTQVIHKESKEYVREFVLNKGEPSYPVKNINSERGLLAPDSLELINNAPFGLDIKGICSLEGGTVRNERNIVHKSSAIDNDLLKEDLKNGVAIDFNFKYWLVFPSGNCYVCDYKHVYADKNGLAQYEWFEIDDVPAICFCKANGNLYFGTADGKIHRFLKYSESDRYQADGKAIIAMWPCKRLNCGTDEYYKYIKNEVVTLKPETRASADVYYITEEYNSPLIQTVQVNIFDFDNIDFDSFSFNVSDFPQTDTVDIKERRVSYYQTILKNDKLNCGMGLQRIEINYEFQGRRK
jgi:hypothetical protein